MLIRRPIARSLAPSLAAVLVGAAAQAQFVRNTTDIPSGNPGNNSNTENVDFGDVDQDGDWDAVFADGGDNAQDQNRIWINLGPGANLGKFDDQTAARFPAVNDQSRDIEFVDFDGDSDLDIYTVNTATLLAQGARWWRNVGGGFYADETASRWIGLGGTGSSIAPSLVLASGTFIDFSGDGDFADIDNDGDMDLLHTSYGSVFGGQIPSRVFLNDGAGFFEEFNPSGFQLSGFNIQAGDPGLWCEGTQDSNTTSSDGTECDIATSGVDGDFGDIDGDFDLDILQGAISELPRMYQNRLSENGGVLSFRDVTGSTFQAGYSTGSGHYEQEMGDLDGDGDLDILGVNWEGGFGFNETTLKNLGDGTFQFVQSLPGSIADDSEGDFIDYDNDGDLDILIANFAGQDRLYRNNNNGGQNFLFTQVPYAPSAETALDSDCCDVDGDGDYDVFTANNFQAANTYFENVTDIPDSHAPYLPNVEQAPDRTPSAAPTVVRVHVYDNAPYYITWYNPTQLIYSVNGGASVTTPAVSSGGQVFRAEIPGSLIGTVQYHFVSEDQYGNQGQSATRAYVAGNGSLNTGAAFCFGDGTGAACPCANGGLGEGCQNSTGGGATLTGFGHASFTNDGLGFSVSGAPAGNPGLILRGTNMIANPVGDGILCMSQGVKRSQVTVTSPAGTATYTHFNGQGFGSVGLNNAPTNFQFYYRDVAGSCTGAGFNFTNAWTVTYLP